MQRVQSPNGLRWNVAGVAAARAVAAAIACTLVGSAAIGWYGVTGIGRTTHRFAQWPFVDMWIRWDAGWYQGIATDGYYFDAADQSSAAFFPVYPLLIRGLVRLGADPFLAGIGLSFAFGVLAAAAFSSWANERAGEQAASTATWALLLWPFAFFLYGAVYSDALFLWLVVSAFSTLERGRLVAATAFGAVATATRPIAIAVVLGLVARQLEKRKEAGEPLRPVDFLPVLSGLGLAAFMVFLWTRFGDPLAFVHAQAGWSQLTGPEAVLKLGLFRSVDSPDDLVLPMLHAVLALSALGVAIAQRHRLGRAYALYVALVLGMPLVSSRDFIGLGRYALAAFPAFLAFARVAEPRPRLKWGWLLLSAGLLLLMTVRWAIGHYVS